ncbi:MAG: DALR anticodon-binding domain-containing protein, partial [Marinirhabdus sp.]
KVVPPQALSTAIKLNEKEKDLIKTIQQFPATILLAAENYSPALIANYVYELVKSFNSFYQSVPILVAGTQAEKDFRVALSAAVGQVTKTAFRLLGISVPEQM